MTSYGCILKIMGINGLTDKLLRMNENRFVLIKDNKKVELSFYYDGGVFYHHYNGIKVKFENESIYIPFKNKYFLDIEGYIFRQKGACYLCDMTNAEMNDLRIDIYNAIDNLFLLANL